MSLKASFFVGLILISACGGKSFTGGGEGGSAGSGSGKGGATGAGGSSSAGSTGKAGAGGGECGPIACLPLQCNQGKVVTRAGECCPSCSCEAIDCAYPVCADGQEPIVQPGDCCPSCPPSSSSCEKALCVNGPEPACGTGFAYGRPIGACCAGCVPIPGQVGCDDVVCDPNFACDPGYVRGDLVGGCCYDCAPDPLYCESDEHCLMADRPRPCCGCPEPVSTRMYDEDSCWSAVDDPRQILMECYPQQICDIACSPCPPPGVAKCVDRRCTQVF